MWFCLRCSDEEGVRSFTGCQKICKKIGALDAIISDASKAQTNDAVRRFCTNIGTSLRVLEVGTPWANKEELYIGIIKEATRKDMKESGAPIFFWDYCLERRVQINNPTAKKNFKLHGTTPFTTLTGEQGHISNLIL